MAISDKGGGGGNSLQGLLGVLLVVTLMGGTLSSMAVKETKVEPFSLLLNHQRRILEEIDGIARAVTLLESRLKSLEYEVSLTRVKVEEAHRDQGVLKIQGILEGCISQGQPAHSWAKLAQNLCRDLEGSFKDGPRDIIKCNLLLGTWMQASARPPKDDVVQVEPPGDIFHKDESWASKHALGTEGNLLLEIGRLISTEANHTQGILIELMSLIHNIEYRQHTMAVAEDTRLATLLQKMAVHQSVLEGRLSVILSKELRAIKDGLDAKFSAIEHHTFRQEQILDNLVAMASNLTLAWNGRTSPSLEGPSICNDTFNCSQLEEGETPSPPPIQDVPQVHTNIKADLPSLTTTTFSNKEETLQGDFPLDGNYRVNLSSSPNLPSTVEGMFINTRQSNDGVHIIRPPYPSLNKVNQAFGNFVKGYQSGENGRGRFLATQDITRISSYLNERVENMENFINKRLMETEERLTGLRIHQTSSLYLHTKEVHQQMEKMERRLEEAIRAGGAKTAKQLDAVQKSLFTFIDAAVTSISSAAVTSSQSTRMLVARDLRESMEELRHFIQEESYGPMKGDLSCPDIYQEVAGNCFLALTHVGVTWGEGCRLCRGLGGYLARPPDPGVLQNLTLARAVWVEDHQLVTQSPECDPDIRKEWSEELTNSLVDLPPPSDGSETPKNGTEQKCSFIAHQGHRFETTGCTQELGVLCQYEPHSQVS